MLDLFLRLAVAIVEAVSSKRRSAEDARERPLIDIEAERKKAQRAAKRHAKDVN